MGLVTTTEMFKRHMKAVMQLVLSMSTIWSLFKELQKQQEN